MDRDIREFWPHDLVLSPLNCRKNDDDVTELKASIAHRGVLQPLIGRLRPDDTAEIVAGGRRMRCARELFDEGVRAEKVRVILLEEGDDADAYEISIAENVTTRPLHPVVEFEAFAALAERGRTPDEIAAHFGITVRQAQQRLALGGLHPAIRAAWHDGRITAEAARAFTLAEPAEQAAYLASAGQNDLRPLAIRDHFARESVPATTPLARFVGADAYTEAGGALVPDLFAEHRDFADGALLRRLAEGILDHEAERVKEVEGWAEVLHGDAARDRFTWQRLLKPPEPDGHYDEDPDQAAWLSLSAEDRAKAVAVLEIGEEGQLRSLRGFIKAPLPKPSAVKPERTALTKAATRAPEPQTELPETVELPTQAEQAKLPVAVLDTLATAATSAAAHVLAGEPRIAFAALIASQVSRGGPIRMSNDGLRQGPSLGWPEVEDGGAAFSEAFRTCLQLPPERLTSLAARVIARSLDFTAKAVARGIDPAAVQDLRCALPAAAHRKALVAAFDASAYFAAAPKEFALAALAECGAANLAAAKLTRAEAAEHAARLAGEQGWLPPLLRGEAFDATAPLSRIDAAPAPEPLTAAEAALQIWEQQEQEAPQTTAGAVRSYYAKLKVPDLRFLLKSRDVTIPFGATREAIIDLACQSDTNLAEASQ
ncbi:putative transcriptional regulator [Bosea sp. 62]|uniref:ParB/RepB/Spo0J family partition protein n=1 Tax=unclassified Bosea (in: a-proteobacteria) TaxID=2653178 RepID=UPI001258ED5B|nr:MULTISPECIES: ParB/RepB/Spo0J family partition protein [unclassified Bosea (in: a-proteobacteria)]CAD5255998.1 putative transcriptional regulator [Bosea sp. 7B]CAD5274687.1 putative transcriptional regulator [Bosea sp. 21B]CAD5275874.1 putative transcriptional regulator [Bosea sp. 46]VVT60073.1 putative transcriptional regulator [Bosea sp. EC-HK365B]VXB54094.1 putative transcriptional regulator [Bosea sp. 62]